MSSVSQAAGVVSFEEARRIVERHATTVSPPETESVDLLSATGRVLAEPLQADRDFPPFDRATRDGYAVRAADVATIPAQLEIVGEIRAGELPAKRLQAREAMSIMTGAALPEGADAVVMIEYTATSSNRVEIQRSVKSGENFVPRNSEARAGQILVEVGTRLDPATIGIAASVGKSPIMVFRRPRVAVLSTGDEVVDIMATPGPVEIRNSNSYSLSAQIQSAGGEPVVLPIAPDEPKRLRQLMEEGFEADLLLLTGGVSMGKYDLVEQVLAELGAEFYLTGAQIQPGRPVVFGSCRSSNGERDYFFGLPGNPVSTMVTFELFVRPMLHALAGVKTQPLVFLKARLKSNIRTKTGLKRFLPGVLSGEFENAEVELASWQGSGDIAALARANCYVVIPPDRDLISAGEFVSLLLR